LLAAASAAVGAGSGAGRGAIGGDVAAGGVGAGSRRGGGATAGAMAAAAAGAAGVAGAAVACGPGVTGPPLGDTVAGAVRDVAAPTPTPTGWRAGSIGLGATASGDATGGTGAVEVRAGVTAVVHAVPLQ
jgi:hypothetical protein